MSRLNVRPICGRILKGSNTRFVLWAALALFATALSAEDNAHPKTLTTRELEISCGVRESFAIADRGKYLIRLPLTVDGKDYPFALDTGATFTVFDDRLRSHLGKRLFASPLGDKRREDLNVKIYLGGPQVSLGSIELPKPFVAFSYDLGRFRSYTDEECYGLLGLFSLKGLVLEIDLDAHRVAVLKRLPREPGQLGEPFPLQGWDGQLWVTAIMGRDIRTPFMVDTGCTFSGVLGECLAAKLAASGQLRKGSRILDVTPSGDYQTIEAQVAAFSLGPFAHRDLQFVCGKGNGNVLGLRYLRRYRIVLDLDKYVLYLTAL